MRIVSVSVCECATTKVCACGAEKHWVESLIASPPFYTVFSAIDTVSRSFLRGWLEREEGWGGGWMVGWRVHGGVEGAWWGGGCMVGWRVHGGVEGGWCGRGCMVGWRVHGGCVWSDVGGLVSCVVCVCSVVCSVVCGLLLSCVVCVWSIV